MKKFLFILLFIPIIANAQNKNFTSAAFDSCRTRWNDLADEYRDRGNKKWASMAAKKFPLNSDKEIEYRYIINAKDSFNMDDMLTHLEKWVKLQFKNAIPTVDKINHTMRIEGLIIGIGQHSGFYSFTTINATIGVFIELKANRIRATSKISHYNLGSASIGSLESNTRLIGDCYPFNTNGDHKNSYSMAFINANSNAIDKIYSLIEYLNTHAQDIYDLKDDNW